MYAISEVNKCTSSGASGFVGILIMKQRAMRNWRDVNENSPIRQLADCQLSDWTTCGLAMPPKERKLSMQSRRWHPRVVQYASCLVREFTSPRVGNPRVVQLPCEQWLPVRRFKLILYYHNRPLQVCNKFMIIFCSPVFRHSTLLYFGYRCCR